MSNFLPTLPLWPAGKPFPAGALSLFYDPATDKEYGLFLERLSTGGSAYREVLLTEAKALLLSDPPSVAPNTLYGITGRWNALDTDTTVYVQGVMSSAYHTLGIVYDAQGAGKLVEVAVAAGTFSSLEASDNPNHSNSLLKAYRCLTRAEIAARGGFGESMEELVYSTAAIGTRIWVEFNNPVGGKASYGQYYVAVYDAAAPVDHYVHVDGSFREGDLTPAKFVPAESAEAKYGYVRRDTSPASIKDWRVGELSIWTISGADQFATAKQAGGPWPAFTGSEDAYWLPAAAPAKPMPSLLTSDNTWIGLNDYSAKGLKLPVGGFVDEAGHLFIRQVDVGQRHFTFGGYYSLAKASIIQWKPDEYVNQDGNGDVGLARNAAGVLEVNTGTPGYLATLLSKDVVALAAPHNLNSITLLAQAVLDTGLLKGAKILWVCGGLSFYSPQRGNPSRPYPTTQQAHDEASSGDLIMVQAGGSATDALGRAYYPEDFLWTKNVRIIFQPGAIHGGLFQLSRFGDTDPATLFKRQLTGGEFTNRTLVWRHSAGDLEVEVTGATFTGNGNFEVAGGGSYNSNFLTSARLRNCLFDVNITNTTLGALRVTGRDDMGPVGAVLENTRVISVRTPTLTFAANAASFVTLQGALTELVGTAPETRPTVPSGYIIAQKEWLLDQRQGVGSSPGGTTTTTELQLYTADNTARVVALALTKPLTLVAASAIAARNVQAITCQVNTYASGNWVAGAERFSLPDAQADIDAVTGSQYEQGAELLFKITAVDSTKPARGLVTINRA